MLRKSIFLPLLLTGMVHGSLARAGELTSNTDRPEKIVNKIHALALKITPDIVYKEVGGEKLLMDFYAPESAGKKAPVMLYIHGGGWGAGNRYKPFMEPHAAVLKGLTEAGIACATLEYRLKKVGKVTVYDSLTDCFDAARFLIKESARFNIDPEHLGVWGGSAGGHLSLVTALAPEAKFPGAPEFAAFHPKFICCLSYYPLTSLVNPEIFTAQPVRVEPFKMETFIGGTVADKRELAELLSPVVLIKQDSPPVFVIHGDNDVVLPVSNTLLLQKTAEERGARVQVLIVKGAGHSLKGENIDPPMDAINQQALHFVVSNLKP